MARAKSQTEYTRYTVRIPKQLYERLAAAAGEKSVNAEIVERLAGESKTLRDEIAYHALSAIVGNSSSVFPGQEFVPWARHAEEAYKVADAMLEARSK